MNAALIAASTLGNVVERIGAYGGLASTIGLGVLALLYFAQAREVKRLREWAGRAPERAADIEQRVQTDAQRRVIATPQTPAGAAQLASPPANLPPSLPSSTAGLTGEAATRAAAAAIVAARATHPPAVGPPGQLARPAVPPAGTPGSPAPAPNPAASAVPKSPGAPAPGSVPPAPRAPTAPGLGSRTPTPAAPPAHSTQAAPPNPAAPAPAKPSAVATMATKPPTATASPPATTPPAKPRVVAQPPAAANGNVGQETRESAAARPEPPLPPLTPPPSRPTARAGDAPPPDDDGDSSVLRIAAIVGGALAVVLVVGLIFVLLSGGDDPAPTKNKLGDTPVTQEEPDPAEEKTPTAAKVNRGATTTTVLNGTTTPGLARSVANKLETGGFKITEVTDNVDQTLPETTVYYSDGNKRAAEAVAKLIGVSASAVQPVDRNVDVASSGTRVVVTVGADLIE